MTVLEYTHSHIEGLTHSRIHTFRLFLRHAAPTDNAEHTEDLEDHVEKCRGVVAGDVEKEYHEGLDHHMATMESAEERPSNQGNWLSPRVRSNHHSTTVSRATAATMKGQ